MVKKKNLTLSQCSFEDNGADSYDDDDDNVDNVNNDEDIGDDDDDDNVDHAHRVERGVAVAEPKCKGETPTLDAAGAGKKTIIIRG